MKKRRILLHGDWEDFELDFIEAHILLWEQSIANVVSDLFVRRLELRMNVDELAKKVGTSASAITRFERMGRMPSLESIYHIANGLGVSIKDLSINDIDCSENTFDMRHRDHKQQWKKDMISIAHELKQYRIKANISQAELASKIGTSISAIARFEKVNRVPSFQFVYRVAEGLGVEMEPLMVIKPEKI